MLGSRQQTKKTSPTKSQKKTWSKKSRTYEMLLGKKGRLCIHSVNERSSAHVPKSESAWAEALARDSAAARAPQSERGLGLATGGASAEATAQASGATWGAATGST